MDKAKVSSVFDNDLYLSWTQSPTCVKCLLPFLQKYGEQTSSRRPYLLPCSHSICDKCLQGHLIQIKCGECNTNITIDKNRHFREQFDSNLYLLGLTQYKAFMMDYNLNRFFRNSNGLLLQTSPSVKQELCCECSTVLTDKLCKLCKGYFCQSCFTTVHSLAKALRSHKLVHAAILNTNTNNLMRANDKDDEIQYCDEHLEYPLIFYCVLCAKQICEDCKDDHEGHELTRVAVDNRKRQSELRKVIDHLEREKKSLESLEYDHKSQIKKIEQDAKLKATEISKQFVYAHSELQNLEKSVMKNLQHFYIKESRRVSQYSNDLNKFVNNLDANIDLLNYFYQNLPENKCLTKYIRQAESAIHQTQRESRKLQNSHLNNTAFFHYTTADIFETLFNNNINMKRTPTTNTNTNMPKQKKNDATASASSASNLTPYNFRHTDTFKSSKTMNKQSSKASAAADAESKYSSRTSLTNINLNMDSFDDYLEKVEVSYIKSPICFYVHRFSALETIKQIQDMCQREACFAVRSTNIKSQSLHLTYIDNENRWVRGLVMKKIGENYRIKCIDFGNDEVVSEQKLHEMSANLKTYPPNAIECTLYNISLMEENRQDYVRQVMAELMYNHKVAMIVLAEEATLWIDIISLYDSYKWSVRDTLVFLNLVNETQSENMTKAKRSRLFQKHKEKNYKPIDSITKHEYKEDEVFDVNVTSVFTPNDFYIVKADCVEANERFFAELNQFYTLDKSTKPVYLPQVGMICAVNINNRWHRGRIVHVLKQSACDIWLIDIGQMENVSWKYLRILNVQFRNYKEAVVNCCLSDISPLIEDRDEWSDKAIAKLKIIAEKLRLRITILFMRDRQYHSILYILRDNGAEICVNAKLVEIGLARSIGSHSSIVEYQNEEIIVKGVDAKLPVALDDQLSKSIGTVQPRARCGILNVISPSQFYCRLDRHADSINRMHSEIQNEDRRMPAAGYIWNETDYCYAQATIPIHGIKSWYRATIVSIDNDEYTVYLRDFGFTVTVDENDLALIDPIIANIGNGSILCQLTCVKPTGMDKTWTKSAIDEFKKATTKFEGYGLTLQGKNDGECKSVILWGVIHDFSDALAPAFYKWTNINNALVQRGLVHLTEKFEPIYKNDMLELQIAPGLDDLDNWLQSKMDILTIANDTEENTYSTPQIEAMANRFVQPYDLNVDICDINEWLPTKPLKKIVIIGMPTFVDNNAVIYFHDIEMNDFYLEMKDAINTKFISNNPRPLEFTLKKGDLCLAKYHLNNQYYRGLVLSVKKNKYKVQFIDYGNVENCTIDELRPEIILGHIPIQAHRVYLGHIRPVNSRKKWSIKTLDFMHILMCDEICSIRILDNTLMETDNPIPAQIQINGIDIIEQLIDENHAIRYNGYYLTNYSILYDINDTDQSSSGFSDDSKKSIDKKSKSKSITAQRKYDDVDFNKLFPSPSAVHHRQNPKILRNFTETKNEPQLTLDDYEKIFQMDKIETMTKDIDGIFEQYETQSKQLHNDNCIAGVGIEAVITENGDQNMVNNAIWFDDINQDDYDKLSSVSHTKPLEGAEGNADDDGEDDADIHKDDDDDNDDDDDVIPSLPFETDLVDMLKLDVSITSFHAKTNMILSSNYLLIEPDLDFHQKRLKEMNNDIQIAASLSTSIVDFKSGSICLARYNTDGLFYRAIILDHDMVLKTAFVVFIDYNNTEYVKECNLRPCPKKLLNFPMLNILIKLNGIRRNRRLRERDVITKLGELLEDKFIFVKVIKHGDIPSVELYADEKCEFEIYNDLIMDRYYIVQ